MARDIPDVGAKKAPVDAPSEEGGKPKAKAGAYALKLGHPTAYRRTVKLDGSSKSAKANVETGTVQLNFEPGVDYELSEVEASACADLIENGFLVPTSRDEKGRQRQAAPSSPRTDADGTIDKLEKQVEDLAAENAELKAQLKNAPKVTIPEQHK